MVLDYVKIHYKFNTLTQYRGNAFSISCVFLDKLFKFCTVQSVQQYVLILGFACQNGALS